MRLGSNNWHTNTGSLTPTQSGRSLLFTSGFNPASLKLANSVSNWILSSTPYEILNSISPILSMSSTLSRSLRGSE